MREILEGIWTWSVFSDAKQLDFNGYYLRPAGQAVLIDPPPLAPDDLDAVTRLGAPARIVLTNKDHRRAAPDAHQRFGAAIAIHIADKPLVDCAVDETFRDGEILAGVLRVVHVPDAKSPGECALYWPQRKILFVGDALIGAPVGCLSLLPAEKFADVAKARAGLRRLAALEVETVLVGDGQSLLTGAAAALRAAAA